MQNLTKQQKILKAATKIFSEKGFHQAKMDEIANVAKVAKGTLYYNYSSKSKLFAATVTDGMKKIMQTISKELESDLPFLDHFRLLLSSSIRLYLKHSEVTKIYVNELSSGLDPETLTEIKQIRNQFIDFVTNILQTGQERGYLKPLNQHLSATALIGIIESLCNNQVNETDDHSMEEIIETIFAILSTGLLNPVKVQF
ncbi:MAG: TetR/AcrR family transcriptional regulator [Proteobacteria bacterium]|nr:TetR/AcrR family transcriptional regulator [Pseudomonadota bacterium]